MWSPRQVTQLPHMCDSLITLVKDKGVGATIYDISSKRHRHCGVNELAQHSKRRQWASNRLPADRKLRALSTEQVYNRPPCALLFNVPIGARCIIYRPGGVTFIC